MSTTGLSQFDETLHLTNSWLKDIMEALGWEDRNAAYRALRTTLHAIRDYLTVDDGAHLAAQLPLMIKGIFYDGWKPARCGGGDRTIDGFLSPVTEAFDDNPAMNAREISKVVFNTLSAHISDGEIEHVLHALPGPVRAHFEGR